MMNAIASAEDARFATEISRSWGAAWAVARHIHSRGSCAVLVMPSQVRPTFADREAFGDAADVWVRRVGGVWRRVEVKGRRISFTSAEDYPYPTIFVDRVEKADKTNPDAYFIVSDDLTHAARIDPSSKPLWSVSERQDRVKGYGLTVYECPVHAARFFELEAAA